MTRREAVIAKLKEYGGWPFNVRRIEVDCECRVFFFDDVYMRGLIDPAEIQELKLSPTIITANDIANGTCTE